MRFASRENTRLGQPEVGVGVHPGGGGAERLPHLVGRARALEIVLGAKDLNHKSETSELGVGIRNIYEMGCSLTPFFRVAVWGLQNYFWAPCFR
jgi:hypothetical protein